MAKYEMLYLLNNDLVDEAKTALIEKYENIVKKMNGVILSTDKVGAKKLAYPIKFKNEAYYVLTTFEAEGSVVNELNRVARIDSDVYRMIVTKKA